MDSEQQPLISKKTRSQTAAPPAQDISLGKKHVQTRTTKTTQKLVVFPEPIKEEVNDLNSEYGEVVQDYNAIKEKEKERNRRLIREELPRVTGYCTAKGYKMDGLFTALLNQHASPTRYDECIYARFIPTLKGDSSPRKIPNDIKAREGNPDLFSTPPPFEFTEGRMDDNNNKTTNPPRKSPVKPSELPSEIFFFEYGVVVTWNLTEKEERSILKFLHSFEDVRLNDEDVEVDSFHYQYRSVGQPRIFNDIITLRLPQTVDDVLEEKTSSDYMIKLTMSHAIAQSVKLTHFECLVDEEFENTKHIPFVMAQTGKVQMSRAAILKKIANLFIMRMSLNLASPILDTPEIFWSEPSLEPIYSAIRMYLEIGPRVELVNVRCGVVGDLLEVLKEHLNNRHGETLEWIVIWLIAIEILIGFVQIFFDFYHAFHKP